MLERIMKRTATTIVGFGVATALAIAGLGRLMQFQVYGQQPASPPPRQGAGPPAQQQLPAPVVDTHHLMELFSQPLYEFLRQSMAQQPTNEEGWQDIANRGLQVAEVANLVALREEASQNGWLAAVAQLQRAGLQLTETARSTDWQATQQAYRTVIDQCNSCHQNFAPDHVPQLRP
jgi:hypothetical protein